MYKQICTLALLASLFSGSSWATDPVLDADAQYEKKVIVEMERQLCATFYNEKEYKAAWESCNKALLDDDPDVVLALGYMKLKGLGTTQDYGEALKYLSYDCLKNNAFAQYNLGVFYSKGLGTAVNKFKALEKFRRAADLGEPFGAYNAGVILENGEVGQPNYPLAVKYYQMAAYRGVGGAMVNLAVLYLEGHGVPQDFVEAYAWLDNACRYPEVAQLAGTNRQKVAKRLNGKFMEQAQRRSREIAGSIRQQ